MLTLVPDCCVRVSAGKGERSELLRNVGECRNPGHSDHRLRWKRPEIYLPEEFLHDKKKIETIIKSKTYTIIPAASEKETPAIPKSP